MPRLTRAVTLDTASGVVICDPVRRGLAPACAGIRLCHPIFGWCTLANLDSDHAQVYVEIDDGSADGAYQSVWIRYDSDDPRHALWPVENAAVLLSFIRDVRGAERADRAASRVLTVSVPPATWQVRS